MRDDKWRGYLEGIPSIGILFTINLGELFW